MWGYALLFHGFAFVLYSLSLFLVSSLFHCPLGLLVYPLTNQSHQPTIIAGLGFATWKAQLCVSLLLSYHKVVTHRSLNFSMSVPPNALAALSIWGTVWLSSRYKIRAPFIIIAASVAILGEFSLRILANTTWLTCFSTFLGYIILITTKTGT